MDEYINRKLITDSLEEIYNDIPVWEDDDDWNRGIKEGIWVAMSCINALPSARPEYTIEMQEADIDEAMKSLRDARVTIMPPEPDVPDTNVGDMISRQAALDALAEHEKSNGHNYTLFVDIVSECAEIIRDLPPAQHERIIGRWVKSMGMNPPEYAGRYQCSECGEWAMRDIKHFKQDLTKFCPHCGAEMREIQDA